MKLFAYIKNWIRECSLLKRQKTIRNITEVQLSNGRVANVDEIGNFIGWIK